MSWVKDKTIRAGRYIGAAISGIASGVKQTLIDPIFWVVLIVLEAWD